MTAYRRAFSLAEVLLSVGIMAMALVALFNLVGSALKNSSRTENLAVAGDVAEQQLNREIYGALNDQPGGARDDFWKNDFVALAWRQGTRQVNHMDFHYAIYAQTVNDAVTGKPIGLTSAKSNRIKKVDIVVWWMHASPHGGRQGYGRLRTGATRIVNEMPVP